MVGITSTRNLGKEEVESIELSIKVAKMKKEKIKNLWVGFGTVTEIKKDSFLFVDGDYSWLT
tara:strand:+ start:285 stop:470 length:186 start_codon:yes stop_codon:yes gene_type:complete